MRARYPDREGYVDSQGVPIFWEEYGTGAGTLLFIPGLQVEHSRCWKMQLPYLARYFRVLTFDPRGAGRSGRPPAGYDFDQNTADALAVLDATGTQRAAVICHSRSTAYGLILAARHPERVERLVLIDTPSGVEYRAFVPDLYAHLAGCDLAVVQGGLSTCMELTATKRPFLYFPLRGHFEQNIHVPHRLARYRAGTRMDYHQTEPEMLAHAIADGLKRPVL